MKKFQKGFMLGAATAAHQVEGNNIHSDYWVQEQIEHSSFDEPSLDAVDHYNRYEEDIKFLADAGLNTYRFSIEWARISPKPDMWVEEEVAHYRDVLECCHKNGVTPIVTMHHFSSPKWLISEGEQPNHTGWENPDVVDKFAAYCERLAKELGDKMEYVCTINEANMRIQLTALIKDMMKRMMGNASSEGNNKNNNVKEQESNVQFGVNVMPENLKLGMLETAKAFGIDDPTKIYTFLSSATPEGDLLVMKAHEAARNAMKAVCPHLKVGLTLSLHDMQPYEGGEAYAEKEWDEEFLHYLPYIKNDDFLGVQCYTRKRFDKDGVTQPTIGEKRTQMGYEVYPIAIANVVRNVAKDFHGDIIITENGIATEDDSLRIEFIKEAINGIMECIEDGLPVKGYMYWSLLDNFEWQKGYKMTFGLIAVDRKTQKRYPKESLQVLGEYLL